MKRRLTITSLCLSFCILMLVIAGCSNKEAKTAIKKDEVVENETANTEIKEVEHVGGTIEIPVNPQRIVDISGMTEELLILGIKPLGTANTDPFDNSKIDALIKEQLDADAVPLGYYGGGAINMEEITALQPDLILTNIRHEKINEQVAKIAPTVIVKDDEYSTDWRGRFVHIGEVFEREADVQKWLDEYDENAKNIHDEITAQTKDETFAVLEVGSYGYRIYGNAGVGDILFNDIKLNPVKETPQDVWGAELSLEGFTSLDPDHIILMYGEEQLKELESSPLWQNMRAVKANNVYKITNEQQYAQAFTAQGKSNLVNQISEKILDNVTNK